MLKHVLMTSFSESDLDEKAWAKLRRVSENQTLAELDSEEFREALGSCDALVLRLGMAADAQLMDAAPELRYIGMYGTGYGRIDVQEASKRGVTVTNVKDYATQSVAEFVVAAAINFLRDLPTQLQQAPSREFQEPADEGETLATQKVGVIGMGAIGSRVADLAASFGCDVTYYSRARHHESETDRIAWMDLKDLLSSCDLVTLHVPATPETSPLLGAEEINLLHAGALLMNTSPNEVVDLDAVERRLRDGSIGYIFDHTDEMPFDEVSKLAKLPGCVAYPPLGYMTVEATAAKQAILVDNIAAFDAGKPTNVVS